MKKSLFITLMVVLLAGVIVAGTAAIAANPLEASRKKAEETVSYDQIYKILKKKLPKNYNGYSFSTKENAMAESVAAGAEQSTPIYSTTNLGEQGVDEADIIKTDGEYIYYLAERTIYITKADKQKLTVVGKIHCDVEGENIIEMFLAGDTLVVIKEKYSGDNYTPAKAEAEIRTYDVPQLTQVNTVVELYSIKDKSKPSIKGSYTQSGMYQTSRLTEGFLYLVTNKESYNIDAQRKVSFLPYFIKDGIEKILPPENIFVNPDIESVNCPTSYSVIGGIDVNGGAKVSAVKAMLGYSGSVYVSSLNMYIAGFEELKGSTGTSSGTRLMRFSLNKGVIKLEANGTVQGTVDDQFSMSEKGDTFRIVTTVIKSDYVHEDEDYLENPSAADSSESGISNSLTVFNLNLKAIGQVSNLAKGEQIYSCRFIENMAYFVTFKNVDPLFAVDLSNPAKPVVVSELKIPGFSDYLQPYGKEMLIGIGMDANEETGETSFVKLSMFDISNPKDVSEIANIVTKEYYSSALNNHKAFLAEPQKNIIAFPGEDNYLIYGYDKAKGFTLKKALKFNSSTNEEWGEVRSVYIGDYIYVVGSGGIATISMKDFTMGEVMFFKATD